MKHLRHAVFGAGFSLIAASGLWAQDAGDTPPEPGLPTPNEVIAEIEDALRVLRKGVQDAALERLEATNDLTYGHEYPSLSNHYPNLGLAYYYVAMENWTEVLRFATSVTTGLTADGFADHPYRLRASVLQGLALHHLDRDQEAEVSLRNAYAATKGRAELTPSFGLALYALARVATWEDLEDEAALRAEFLNNYDSRWLVSISDAVHMNYLDIEDANDNDVSRDILLSRTLNLIKLAETVPEVSTVRTVFYKGFYANLLALERRYEEALPYLEEQRQYYREADLTGTDVWSNVRRLGAVMSFAVGPAEAYQHFTDELIYAREKNANIFNLSLYQRELGHLASRLEDPGLAQTHYRDAYAEARRGYRANSSLAVHLRKYIDLDHPGMQGFDFAPELGALDAVDFDLSQDGSGVVRLFFEGNYLALEALLKNYANKGEDNSAAYRINEALYLAMKGNFDEALATLAEARRITRTTTDAGIAANAMIFDIVEVIARVWGTGHQPETAQGALGRLRARLPGMNESETGLYYALLAFKHFRTGDLVEMRAMLRRWFDQYDASRTSGVWDIFSATIVMEMSFGNMDEALNDDLMANTLSDLENYPAMTLSRDYLRLVKVLNSRTGVFSDEALVELGTLAASIGAVVPENHSLLAATQFALANAHGWRGNNEEALDWMRKTTVTLRGSPYYRKDVHAFLLGRQSDYLRILGRVNEAYALSSEALANFDPHSARNDLIGSIYESTALALWERSSDYEQVAALLDIVLQDEELFGRMEGFDKVALLRIKADALSNYAELPEVLSTLDRASFEMDNDTGPTDWRLERSNVSWSRAIANYWNNVPGEGFVDMMRSNDIYSDWQVSIRAGGGGDGIDPGAFKERADWEALIGWDYAQTLPPDPPAAPDPAK